ncbi:MAG TPA: SCO family protein [Gammaproteobacteria bacterium]|nr:SCO family protein [Gammaproteobacteria bacterium]
MSKPIKLFLGSLSVLLLLGAALYLGEPEADAQASDNNPAKLATPKPLSEFQLMASDGRPLNRDRLKGKWTLLFFGYTHCPDVCPTTLSELATMAGQLTPEIHKDTQFIFVSVDPRRDTPQSLAEYVQYFDPRFIGATGSIEELAVLVRQLDSKFSLGTSPLGEAIVNHSSAVMVIDPQVRYYARLSAPHYAEDLLQQYLALRQHTPGTPIP